MRTHKRRDQRAEGNKRLVFLFLYFLVRSSRPDVASMPSTERLSLSFYLLWRRLKWVYRIIKEKIRRRQKGDSGARTVALYFHHDEIDSPVATTATSEREMKVVGGDVMRRWRRSQFILPRRVDDIIVSAGVTL